MRLVAIWVLVALQAIMLVYYGIFNYSLASEQYSWNGYSAYAIPPNPPASTNTITGEPLPAQSHINTYNTAFNQQLANPQQALNKYYYFSFSDVDSNFINGTFGYDEEYSTPSQLFYINYLQNDASAYFGIPYLFISAGSGGGSGFMYLNWIIVTYGVPYIVNVS